mmetsp:Transcript_9880/g.24903  ORF Transcript_9880/g.24903 Transcript_9880/m.24903 type:complete len:231 (+) Transcript_9880:2319-3011(+)
MPLLAFQNFRRDVVGGATDCVFFLTVVFEMSSETEITNFETVVRIQEKVAQLEVAVDHTTLMEVFQRNDEVVKVEHRLWFRKPFAWSFAHEFVQSLARTQLQDDVHEIVVLEIIVEFHYLLVVQRPVDCNLRPQFCHCSRLCNRGFGNNFSRKHAFAFHVLHLETLGETTLTKEAPLAVALRQATPLLGSTSIFNDVEAVQITVRMSAANRSGCHRAKSSFPNYMGHANP